MCAGWSDGQRVDAHARAWRSLRGHGPRVRARTCSSVRKDSTYSKNSSLIALKFSAALLPASIGITRKNASFDKYVEASLPMNSLYDPIKPKYARRGV